jgi:hypothetical protein
MSKVEHVAHISKIRNANKTLVPEPERNLSHGDVGILGIIILN